MLTRTGVTRTSSGYRSIRETQGKDLGPYETLTPPSSSGSVRSYLLFIIFIATLGPFQFGYHLGELNAPEIVIRCGTKTTPTAAEAPPISSFLPQCISMNEPQWGMAQSIFTIGGLFGSLAAGPIATNFGRLLAMMLLTCALAAGSAIEAMAFSISTIAMGRFVSGIGAGAATVVCPMYISEMSDQARRGTFGAFSQVMINAGILTAQVLGYFLSRGSLWRIILALPFITSLLTIVALLFAPETPVWLASNGNQRMARYVLQRVRGPEADIRQELLDLSISAVDDEEQSLLTATPPTRFAKQAHVGFVDVIRIPRYRKAVVAVTATFVAQQLCGINSVVMYSVAILGDIIPSAAALITVMVSAINLTVSVLCTPLPDRVGRKGCLLLSIAGMGTSSAMLALGLSQDLPSLTVISLFTFVASFGVGLGPVPFILASEAVGPEAVGALSGWALAGNWLSTFSVAQFFPILNNALAEGEVFWIFAGIAVLLGTFIAWTLPETKGQADYEEI